MPRPLAPSAHRALVALAAGTAVLAIGAATATSALAATTPTVTTLVSASFDSLVTGRVTPDGFNKQLGSTSKATSSYDDMSAITVTGHGQVVRTKLDAGSYHTYPAGNNGAAMFVTLPRVVNNACLQYDIRFDGSFDWSMGGKLPGLEGVAPGVYPSVPTGGTYAGSQGWSGRLMWLGPKAYSWAGPVDQAVTYMYNPLQSGSYGDNVRWNKAFVAGQWHTVKVCYTMNTVGYANGKLQAWMDGVQVLNNTAYKYRTRSDVGISHIAWHLFRGGNNSNWASGRTGYVDIDNVKVTTVG